MFGHGSRLDELHEEIRGLTLRLPERGMDPYDGPVRGAPPIPPAARDPGLRGSSLGDPVADRMLAQQKAEMAELVVGAPKH